MRYCLVLLAVVSLLSLSGVARAAEHEPGAARAEHAAVGHGGEADSFPHPTIAKDAPWAGFIVVVILVGFFFAAAVIGPVVRFFTPEEVPPAHSHDEPPGASHHHGASGTHAEEPHH